MVPNKTEYAKMKSRLKPGESSLHVHRFPSKLRHNLRVAAVKAKRTVTAVIVEACEQWLKRTRG